MLQELVYVWNGFNILGKKVELLEPFLVVIEKKLNDIIQKKSKFIFFIIIYLQDGNY